MSARVVKPAVLAAVLALVSLVPFLGLSAYGMSVAVLALVYVVLGQGLNLIYGYTGWLSFAQVGFWGLGAYTAALLWTRHGLNPWAGVAIGGVVAAVAAVAVGLPSLRLSRTSFIIVTLTFSLLLQLLALDWIGVTRGPLGLPSLPALEISVAGHTASFATAREFYWVILAWAVVTLAIVYRVVRSRLGRTLLAIRSDEYLAQAQGIPVLRYKIAAFALAAWVSGVAGGLYGFYLSVVDPSIFAFSFTQAMLVVVVVGGRGSFWGVTIGAVVLSAAPELLRFASEWRLIGYGVVLVVVVLTMPGGFAGLVNDRLRRRRERTEQIPALQGGEA